MVAAGNAQGEVVLVVQYQTQGCIIWLTRFHGQNVVSYEVVTSNKRTLLIGILPPPLHPGALTGLGGGPDIIIGPVYHCVRGPQC